MHGELVAALPFPGSSDSFSRVLAVNGFDAVDSPSANLNQLVALDIEAAEHLAPMLVRLPHRPVQPFALAQTAARLKPEAAARVAAEVRHVATK